jgi:nicotinamidase/pyrazinamidase
MSRILLVIDMLEGFLRKQNPLYCGPTSEAIIPFVKGKIEEYSKTNELVIFVADNHDQHDWEFKKFPPHCVRGTHEAEVVHELKGIAKREMLIPKTRYSAFYKTNIDQVLEKEKPDLVEVVGVCTNICVLYTVEELENRDYHVRVYKNGCASFDQEAHEWALKQIKTVLGAEVA